MLQAPSPQEVLSDIGLIPTVRRRLYLVSQNPSAVPILRTASHCQSSKALLLPIRISPHYLSLVRIMTNTTAVKNAGMHHVEDSEKQSPKADIITEQENQDADELERKYHIPLKAALESHLEEDSKAVRKVIRKVDFRLVPMLALLYMWAFIDRANLGNVRTHLSFSNSALGLD